MHVLQRKIQKRRRNDQLERRLSHKFRMHLRQILHPVTREKFHQKLDRSGRLLHQSRHQFGIDSDMHHKQPRRTKRFRHLRLLLRQSEIDG